jgi:hypothetical protein
LLQIISWVKMSFCSLFEWKFRSALGLDFISHCSIAD